MHGSKLPITMRLTPAFAAVGLGVVCACAQLAPPADQARRLLQAQSLRDKTWGAWFAGVSHDPTLREPLLAQLRLAQPLRDSERDTEGYAYIQALFDSLIEIPGPIPSDVILPFEASWRAEVLILLSREPDGPGNESNLLAMREESMPDPEWAAVNDLLFSVSSKPFFQRTLQEIRITHDFLITDREVGLCGGTTACGSSTRRFPKGFPPVALYQLQTEMAPGDALVVDRPVAIYYRRTVVPTDGEVEWNECESDTVPTALRQTWLARFLSAIDWLSTEQSEQLFHPQTIIKWHGAAEAAAEMEGLLARQAASIQTLVGHAQERKLVQASGMPLTIKTTIEDVRGDRSVPAPAVAPREIVIK
jgi:hypothetical protein